MRARTELEERLAGAFSHPLDRPLALCGPTGAGKTTLLRQAAARSGRETVWLSASDLVHDLTAAIRDDRYRHYRETLLDDPRPLCVEHLEDLRGKPRTRAELEWLLRRVSPGRPLLLTLTRTRGDTEVRRWLRAWTDVFTVSP